MKADNRSGFHYKGSKNTSSKVLGMHKKIDTKTLNKLFSDSWPTDYNMGDCLMLTIQLFIYCGARLAHWLTQGVSGSSPTTADIFPWYTHAVTQTV